MLDQVSNTQKGSNEKGKLPSYPIDSMRDVRQVTASPLLISDFGASAPQDFTKLLMHQEAKFN